MITSAFVLDVAEMEEETLRNGNQTKKRFFFHLLILSYLISKEQSQMWENMFW